MDVWHLRGLICLASLLFAVAKKVLALQLGFRFAISSPMFRFYSSIALDLRSIALFRMMFGGILLFDLLSRLPHAELFLSDSGALSRSDLLAVVDRPWAFSVYMICGEASQVAVLLLVHALFALCLILGLWTRVVSILSWVLLISLQHRNPLVLNGGDTLFSVYAFWLMFLPLNARWSLDSLLASKGENGGAVYPSHRYVGIPGAALILQTVFVYVFTVLLKSGEMWNTGEVVPYVIRNLGLIKQPAVWFQQFDSVHGLMSRMVFHWEWFGCLLVLSPWATGLMRSFSVVGFFLLHLTFGLMLDLAIFPAVSILGWAVFVPGCWWRVGRSLGFLTLWSEKLRLCLIDRFRVRGSRILRRSLFASIVTGLAIFLVFVWNLRGLPDSSVKEWIPKTVEKAMYSVKLRQKWGMFAPNPSRYSQWFALEAQLANGDSVDLFNPGEAFTLRRPFVFTDRLPDRRWGKFMSNLKRGRYAILRDDYVEYFMNRWNESVGASSKIEKTSLLWIRERIGEDGNYYDREVKTLGVVFAKGVAQIRAGELEESSDSVELEEDL